MGVYKYWILWLLLWQVASCSAKDLHCGPASSEAAAGSASNTARFKPNAEDMLHDPFAALEPSLHSYIYSGDFVGFSHHLRLLAQHETFPSLLGAIQAGDDRGMTVAHLLACAGRQQELSQLVDILFRMQGDGVEMIRRVVLESRNHDACKGKKCDKTTDRPGLYAHGTLQLPNPPQQVVLFGDVTPLECAAAHGHLHAMKLLIQGGVAPGKVFEVAQVFSLTKHLHQAIQLANAEGFLAQPKVFLPSPKASQAQLRQPRTRRSSGGSSEGSSNGKAAATGTKNKSSSQGAVKESKRATNELPNAVVNTASGSAPGASTILSSSSGSSATGNTSATESTPGPKVAKMSEMVDIAALLLLTGMLLLPLWSTICLLWRRAVRKRASVTEPARRIKQAMMAATSGALSHASSLRSTSSTADSCPGAAATAVTGSKKGKTGAAGTVRQRKAQALLQASQPSSTSSSTAPARTTIPVLVSHDDTNSQESDDTPTADAGPGTAAYSVQASGHIGSRGSNPVGLDTHNALKAAETSSNISITALHASNNSNSTGAAGRQKRSKPQGPSTAVPVVLSAVSIATASRSSSTVSTGSSELSGPATSADSMLDVSAAAATPEVAAAEQQVGPAGTAHTCAASACPSQGSLLTANNVPASSEQRLANCDAAEHVGSIGMPAGAALSSGSNSSKRRVTGSRSLGAAAAAAQPTLEVSPPMVQPQVAKSVITKQPTGNSSSSSQRPARGKQRGAKCPTTAATSGGDSRADASHSPREALLHAQRSASATAVAGGYEAVAAAPPQLRVLSAEDAAQTAKVYAALVAPYTPSPAAAAARPAIYQPPGTHCCGDTCSDSGVDAPVPDAAEYVSTSSKYKQRHVSVKGQHGDVQPDDIDLHSRDQYRSLARLESVPAPAGDVTDNDAATHLPAEAIQLGSAAADETGIPVESWCSGPVNLTPTYSSGSSSSSSSSDRPSSKYALHVAGTGCGQAGSKETTFINSNSYTGATMTAAVARKLSDAASVHSDTSFCSIGSPSGGSSSGRCWPPQPPPPPPRATPAAIALAAVVDRSGAISPFDEGLLSPPAAGSAGVIGSGAVSAAAAAAAAGGGGDGGCQAGREDHIELTTALSSLMAAAAADATSPTNHHSGRAPDSSASSHADTAQQIVVADTSASGINVPGHQHAPVGPHTAQSSVGIHTAAAAADANAVLGAADAEVAFPPRINSCSGSSFQGCLNSQLHSPGAAQQQQQLQPLSQNMQALASQLLHSPIQGSSNSSGQGLSPQVLAQMASTWQHQQQQAAVCAQQQQQQQWLVASAGQPAMSQQGQQASQLLLQPPVSAAAGGPAAVLPAGMVALMQASQSQAAVLQQRQQQQQQLQQQKLMVFVPQQSGFHVASSPGGAIPMALSPQQRAMLLSQGSSVPARPLVQQQQQSAAVSAAPYCQQVVYLQQPQHQQQQQQQQLHVVQVSGALQGGALRVFHPSSGLQVQQGGPLAAAAAAAGASHGSAQVVLSPAGPGVAFVAGQRLAGGGGGTVGLSPAAVQVSPMSSGMTAAAFASIATNSAGVQLNTLQQGNSASASQQLLAMVPGLHQGRQQQVLTGQNLVNAKFDWTTLASELAGGPAVGPASAGTPAAFDLADPPGLYPPGLMGAVSDGSPEVAYAAAAPGASSGGGVPRHQSAPLTIEVPEVCCDGSQHSESARMAAELDELLHQANQQLGWSGIPRAFDGCDNSSKVTGGSPGLSKTPPHTPPAAVATVPGMPGTASSTLKPDAPEYQPRASTSGAGPAVNQQQQAAGAYGSSSSSSTDDRSVHLRSLEALQLPDGFCAGD